LGAALRAASQHVAKVRNVFSTSQEYHVADSSAPTVQL
jgi:hypothetical protein